jgi:hypothetical protein
MIPPETSLYLTHIITHDRSKMNSEKVKFCAGAQVCVQIAAKLLQSFGELPNCTIFATISFAQFTEMS